MDFQPRTTTTEETRQILDEQRAAGFATIKFEQVDDFTTFRAEVGIDGDTDLVFHFYKAAEMADPPTNVVADQVTRYWQEIFPGTLDVLAQEFFEDTYPTLRAAFTHELDSWWFRACGKARGIDPIGFAKSFLKRLDQALDAANVNAQPR